MTDDTRQAGKEIEITDAMIEAGAMMIVDHEQSSPAFLAEQVFLIMKKAQFES